MDKIYLNVPYAEKDKAKSLGAKWDAITRKWYISENTANQALFSAWRSDALFSSAITENSNTQETLLHEQATVAGMCLSELMAQANTALRRALPNRMWVFAEITEMSQHNGHIYLTLAESKQGQQIAQARATIWASQSSRIISVFKQATDQTLSAGLSVLLAVEVSIHPKFGLSLTVLDINPQFTLGEQEAKKQTIRAKLKEKNIFHLNKQRLFPQEITRVAVIAPAQAAGLGDFRNDATQLATFGLCQFDYFYATFQGTSAAESLVLSFMEVKKAQAESHYDLLVIIRGGGAKQDLMFLNEFTLAEQVCHFPIPVVTGIGHERDSTILDEVANKHLDTPSKVIAFIRQHIVDNALYAKKNWLTISNYTQHNLIRHKAALKQYQTVIQHGSLLTLQQARQRLIADYNLCQQQGSKQLRLNMQALTTLKQQLLLNGQRYCITHNNQLMHWQKTIKLSVIQQITSAKKELLHYQQIVQSMHPNRLLKLGYSLTLDALGKPITSARNAEKAPSIQLVFQDGRIIATPQTGSLSLTSEASE